MLRDRIACGIANKRVQRRLLQTSDLTFEKALEMALAAETAERDSRRLQEKQARGADNTIPNSGNPAVHKVNRVTRSQLHTHLLPQESKSAIDVVASML